MVVVHTVLQRLQLWVVVAAPHAVASEHHHPHEVDKGVVPRPTHAAVCHHGGKHTVIAASWAVVTVMFFYEFFVHNIIYLVMPGTIAGCSKVSIAVQARKKITCSQLAYNLLQLAAAPTVGVVAQIIDALTRQAE